MAGCSNALQFVENDAETIRLVWEDQDLSEFDSVRFRIRFEDGSLLNVPGIVIEPGPSPDGITDFEIPAGSLPAGTHEGEFVITVGGEDVDTFPDEAAIPVLVRSKV